MGTLHRLGDLLLVACNFGRGFLAGPSLGPVGIQIWCRGTPSGSQNGYQRGGWKKRRLQGYALDNPYIAPITLEARVPTPNSELVDNSPSYGPKGGVGNGRRRKRSFRNVAASGGPSLWSYITPTTLTAVVPQTLMLV